METVLIIALIILGVIIVGFATRFIGDAFKIGTRILLVIIVILAFMTYFVYKDIAELKEDISTKRTVFLLQDSNGTYAAVGINPVNGTKIDFESLTYYTDEQLQQMAEAIEKGRSPDLQAARAFIISPKLVNKTYSLDFGTELDENDMLEILKSDQPYEVMAQKISPTFQYSSENLEKAYGHEGVIKGYLLAALIINYFKEPGQGLSKSIKSGELRTVPDSFSFKAIRTVPMIGPD